MAASIFFDCLQWALKSQPIKTSDGSPPGRGDRERFFTCFQGLRTPLSVLSRRVASVDS